MRKIVGMFFCLQLLWSGIAAAQNFTAAVNRTELPQGETLLLTLETNDDKSSATPDLSVLEKDFNIYSVGNAYRSSYVNGVTEHSRQWQIVMMPKKSGQIEIPAIKFGTETSEPITLNVVPADLSQVSGGQTQPAADTAPKFAIEASVDNKNPYVQQQINYTLSIYDSGGLYGEAPVIMDNGSNDWIVKSLGEPVVNTKVINGRQLREIQFKYAMFPQKSGVLPVPDIEFHGYYLTRSRRGADAFDDVFNSGFFNMGFSDMFATRNPVVLKPENISIDVRPVPSGNGGHWWLPASQVVLSAEWEDKNPVFKVGEAVSRSVYLKAAGVTENQLPDLKFAELDGVRQYPEKPVAMSSQYNNEVVSIKKFGNVFIPEKAGKMTIPAVSVDWYNVHTGQLEKAVLPAQTVKVLPAAGGTLTTETPQNTAPETKAEQRNSGADVASAPVSDGQNVAMIVIAFALGLIFSYILFGSHGCRRRQAAGDYVKKIKEAASAGDLKALRDNLLAWARLVYDDASINNVDDILKHGAGPEFKLQLEQLGQALYSGRKGKFSSEAFMAAFAAEQKRRKTAKGFCVPLPELYK